MKPNKQPPTPAPMVTAEGMTVRATSCKATCFKKGFQSVRPPPDEWVSQEGPAPLLGWGNRGTRRRDDRPEASLRDLRRSGGPEAPVLRLMLRSRLPPPLRWRRRASAPQFTHTLPGELLVSPGSKGRIKKSSRALPPRFVARERWERACLGSNMAATRPPPHPSLPQAGDVPSRPSGGREDGPNPPDPFSPLPLLADGVTYPT